MRNGKSAPLAVVGLVLLASVVVAAVHGSRPRVATLGPMRVLKVSGVESCSNYSRSVMAWMTMTLKDRPAGLLARDGDVLWFQEKHEYAVPYRRSDGASLLLKEEGRRLLLGDRPVALNLEKDTAGWQWLSTAAPADLAGLRSVSLPDRIDSGQVLLLKKLADADRHIGLVAGGEPAGSALALFTPRLLITSTEDLGSAPAASLREVTFLGVSLDEGDTPDLQVLTRLPSLRQMLVTAWDPERTGPLPADLKRLQSLAIVDGKAKNLESIARLTGLKELHLIKCEDLTDLSALSAFSELETLTLTGCKKVTDLSVLKKLPRLQWLSLPPGVSQEDFAAIIRDHRRLRVVELIGCEEIKDLGPLRDLRDLEALVLLGTPGEPATLREMKRLRLLVLPKDGFEEPADEVRELEKDLPECLVVAGEGMCLGSGWIVLLVPFAAGAWFLSDRRRARGTNRA